MKLVFAGIGVVIIGLVALCSAIFYSWINATPNHPVENEALNQTLSSILGYSSFGFFIIGGFLVVKGVKLQNKKDALKKSDNP